MKKLRLLALLLVATVPFAACDDEGPTPVETGSIQGTVVVEGSPLQGVTVAISGAESATATTDASGQYSFASVPAGSYTIELAGGVPDDVTFEATSKSANVSGGQTATVDFSGDYIRTAVISGRVTAQTEDGEANVEGITVNLSGTESRTAQTDANGAFVFDGLRAGSYTVSIDASGLDIEFQTTSQQVQVSVGGSKEVNFTGLQPRAAQVYIQQITGMNRGMHIDPDDVEGRIFVDLAVDPGTETVSRVAIALNGTEVASQDINVTAASSAGAAASAQPTVTLSVNTAAFDESTLEVEYPNGEYELTASLETAEGSTAMASQSQTLTFDNEDLLAVEFVDGSGNEAVSDGVRWHGGASFQLEALALLYSAQVQIDQVGVTCFYPDADPTTMGVQTTPTANGGANLDLNGEGAGVEALVSGPPFEYTAALDDNDGAVEDLPPSDGGTGQTCSVTSVVDPDGLELIDQFDPSNVMNLEGFFADFVGPQLDDDGAGGGASEVVIDDAVVTADHYSAGEFGVSDFTELGVGMGNIDVNLEVAGDVVVEGPSTIASVPERALEYDGVLDVIEDALGNDGDETLADATAATFGVDKGAPALSAILPAASTSIVLNKINNDLSLTAEDPDLADESSGSGFDAAGALTVVDSDDAAFGVITTTVNSSTDHDYSVDVGGEDDDTYTLTAEVEDEAVATGNSSSFVWNITLDGTAPGLALSDLPQSTSTTADSVRVTIGGTLTDANGIDPDASTIVVQDAGGDTGPVDGNFCNDGDETELQISATPDPPGRQINRNDVSIGTSFNEEFWLVRDGFGGTTARYCFVVTGSDLAKDVDGDADPNTTTQVTQNSITWN